MNERTAKKLLPIYKELCKRAVQFKKSNDKVNKDEDSGSEFERVDTDGNEAIDASYFNPSKSKDRRSKTPDG